MNMRTRKITVLAILIAIGIIMGYIESFINVIPVSGVKIGLSNMVLLYCIYKLSITDTLIVATIKSILNGILFSGIMSIIYSLSASIVSVTVMILLFKYVKKISVYGISMCGSCVFNITQFIVASIVLGNFLIMINLWYVLPISLVTGLILGEVYRIIFLKDS